MKAHETTRRRYVETFVIDAVDDPFNAEFLWRRPGLFGGRGRLRELLEAHPRARRYGRVTGCFCHVELRLPRDEVEHDRRIGRGERARELCAALEELHRRDFGKLIEAGATVRYRVVTDDDMAPDRVGVRFGHALYIAAEGEAPRYRLSTCGDGTYWKPLAEVPAAQRLLLIGGQNSGASVTSSDWPWPGAATLMLLNEAQAAGIELAAEPEGCLLWHYDARQDAYALQAAAAPQDAAPLLLRIERLEAEGILPSEAAAVEAGGEGKPDPVIGNATFIPIAPAPIRHTAPVGAAHLGGVGNLSLVALALPRLSAYRHNGVRELVLGFDEALNPMPLAPGRVPFLCLRLGLDDQLYAETPAGRRRLPLPIRFFPRDSGEIRLDPPPPPLQESYLGVLHLPRPLSARLPLGTRLVVGRGNPLLAELRILDDPGYLRMAPGAEPATPDRLGFSRKAFALEAGEEALCVTRLAEHQSLLHLDDTLAPVVSIDMDSPCRLPPGHHLAAGHYILRYDA